MKNNNLVLKVSFYFISLWLLFLLISIISFNYESSISIMANIKNNIVTIIFIVLALFSFVLRKYVDDKTKGMVNPTRKIIKVENKNFEFLTFLTTYIIPLAFIEFTKIKYLVVLIIILLFTGFVFTKMDLFLANPTLALFYKLYEIEVKDGLEVKKVTVITKDKLKKNDDIEWVPFDDNNWFVRRKEDGKSKKQISKIINSRPTINLFFMLKSDDGIIVKRADLESETAAPQLCKLYVDQIKCSVIDNDSLSLINLSNSDERKNAIYKYDYADYTEELETIHNFKIEEAIEWDVFNFNDDNISQLFAFLIYIGSMDESIVLFKKHYPVTMIKRGTFLLFKRGERLEKFDDSDIFRMNGDFNFFAINGEVYVRDLDVLEKNCGFQEFVKARAKSAIEIIEEKELVENISDFSETAQDINFAKRLSKLYKNSPVLDKKISNERIIEFCKSNPMLKDSFKYTLDGTKFILDSKKAKEKFMKMLNDDYLMSQLTNSYYDSIAKDSIDTEPNA